MPDLLDYNDLAIQVKLSAIVAGPDTEATGQRPTQRFGATDIRPLSNRLTTFSSRRRIVLGSASIWFSALPVNSTFAIFKL